MPPPAEGSVANDGEPQEKVGVGAVELVPDVEDMSREKRSLLDEEGGG